jgi:long-chain acyl-CoA synthetase
MGKRANMNNTDVTMPKLLKANAEKWADVVWMRKKEFGIWRKYTWKEGYDKVRRFAFGLASLGFNRGDALAIIGDNDPHWFWAELGAHCIGGIVCGIHSGNSAEEVVYHVDHSDAKYLVAQDQEQVDKVLNIKDKLSHLKRVIYWDGKGLKHYDDPLLISFDAVCAIGEEYEKSHQELLERSIEEGRADDVALIQYTSGTTGLPKGALMTWGSIAAANENLFRMNPIYPGDEWLSFVLPGWMTEQGLGLMSSLNRGLRLNFPESQETVNENIREIGASILFYPSRLWESVASSTQNRIEQGDWWTRLLYKLCMRVGYKVADMRFQGDTPGIVWSTLYRLCYLVMFRPLKDRLGLLKLRYAYTAGSLLGPDVFRMMTAIGVDLRQIYGSSEVGVSQHIAGDIKVDSVGRVNPNTIVRILDDNHILVRGTAAAIGYHKDAAATKEKFSEGWFRSGDAGYIDDDGHVYYLDRLEYISRLADGTRFAPQYIESRLKFSSYVKDAFVLGDESKNMIAAVVNIQFENVGHWAERHKIPYTTFADLSQKKEVCELIASEIKKVNARLQEKQKVKRFVNMPKEFDPDEAELTRTMKLRRGFLERQWKSLIDALYGADELATMQVPVSYRDGRKSVMEVTLRITTIE